VTQQKPPRKPYHAPKLTTYGDVKAVTKGTLAKKGDHAQLIG